MGVARACLNWPLTWGEGEDGRGQSLLLADDGAVVLGQEDGAARADLLQRVTKARNGSLAQLLQRFVEDGGVFTLQ